MLDVPGASSRPAQLSTEAINHTRVRTLWAKQPELDTASLLPIKPYG